MGKYNILPRKNEPAIVKKLTKVLPSFPSKMTDLQENQQMSSLSQSKVNKDVNRIFLPLSGILLIIIRRRLQSDAEAAVDFLLRLLLELQGLYRVGTRELCQVLYAEASKELLRCPEQERTPRGILSAELLHKVVGDQLVDCIVTGRRGCPRSPPS